MRLSTPHIAVLSAVAGAALGAGVVLVLSGDDSPPAGPAPVRQAFSVVPDKKAGQLAVRFRPRLMFDSDERWRPISLDALFGASSGGAAERFCQRAQSGSNADCQPVETTAEFERLVAENSTFGSKTYLDIPGENPADYRSDQRGAQCAKQGLFDCDDNPNSAIYYRVTQSNQRFYVDYWWLLRYNHFRTTSATCAVPTDLCGDHEGDWEGVTLVTKPELPRQLDYAVYAAHSGLFRYPADQLQAESDQRPKVFVAEGSHASYPKACPSLCFQPIALVGSVKRPETTADGERAWARNEESCLPNEPGSCLLALPAPESNEQAWTAWPGLWGETCGERCAHRTLGHPESPASPGLQARFQAPWCSTAQGGVPLCDGVAQGCRDWLGPVVSVLACDPRALGRGLTATEDLPAGDLAITINSPRPKAENTISATTRGIVQAVGRPLTPGDQVLVSGVDAGTEVLIRARQRSHLFEARFALPAGTTGPNLHLQVASRDGRPVVAGALDDGSAVRPLERQRASR